MVQAGSVCRVSCSGRWWQWDSVENVYQAHTKNLISIWITQCIWTPLKARIFSSLQFLNTWMDTSIMITAWNTRSITKSFSCSCSQCQDLNTVPRSQHDHTLICQIIRYTYLIAWCTSFRFWNSMNLPRAFGWLQISLSLGWDGKIYIWSEPL